MVGDKYSEFDNFSFLKKLLLINSVAIVTEQSRGNAYSARFGLPWVFLFSFLARKFGEDEENLIGITLFIAVFVYFVSILLLEGLSILARRRYRLEYRIISKPTLIAFVRRKYYGYIAVYYLISALIIFVVYNI
jgi:hypothetical protein